MKTAYELAMERLNKQQPAVKLTAAQKRALSDLEAKYKAKIAEREIFLQGQFQKAAAEGNAEALEQLDKQLTSERRVLQAELEEKKDAIRSGKG
jgi:hypothetical protein